MLDIRGLPNLSRLVVLDMAKREDGASFITSINAMEQDDCVEDGCVECAKLAIAHEDYRMLLLAAVVLVQMQGDSHG